MALKTESARCRLPVPSLSPLPAITTFTFPGCCRRRRKRAPAMCSPMAPVPECATPSWPRVAAGLARTRHRHFALSVPLHGTRQQTTRPAASCARDGARRRGGRAAGAAGLGADRRRQIVRRPHDFAGAGPRAAPGRARTGLPRLSATSGRQAVARARRASFRHSDPDAVSAGNARYARHARPDRAAFARRSGPGATLKLFATPIIRSTCRSRSGRKDAQVLGDVLDALAGWIDKILRAPAPAR